MPFAVSIGDGIAIATLIVDITKSLRDIGGAKSDYQELIRELDTLQKALTHLDSLQSTAPNSQIYDSIKFAALSCRQPLEEFLRKAQKYEKTLGLWRAGSAVKAAKDKLQWTFGHKDAVDKLQKYLNIHVGTINMMLTEYGLESMTVAANKANMDNTHLQERLDSTRTLVERLSTSVQGQDLIIRNTNSLITRLFNIVSGELKVSWQSLFDMVAKVCVSTQQIYSLLLEIKSSSSGVDTRWTFFQAPFVVEDAFGFRFPVPSEYDYTMLNNIIQWRFQDRETFAEVRVGNYELYKTQKTNEIITVNTFLTPGTFITMAIIVHRFVKDDECCPMPHCGSRTSLITLNGGRKCADCNVCFDQATKSRRSLGDFFGLLDDRNEGCATNNTARSSNLRHRQGQGFPSSTEMMNFRHVRWADNDRNENSLDDEVRSISDLPLEDSERESRALEQIRVRGIKIKRPPAAEPILDDAFSFLDLVKVVYADSPQVYDQYLDALRDFKVGIIDTPGVVERIIKLFQDSPSLLQAFNVFLPPTFQIEIVGKDELRHIRVRTLDVGHEWLGIESNAKNSTYQFPESGEKRRVTAEHDEHPVRRSKRRKSK